MRRAVPAPRAPIAACSTTGHLRAASVARRAIRAHDRVPPSAARRRLQAKATLQHLGTGLTARRCLKLTCEAVDLRGLQPEVANQLRTKAVAGRYAVRPRPRQRGRVTDLNTAVWRRLDRRLPAAAPAAHQQHDDESQVRHRHTEYHVCVCAPSNTKRRASTSWRLARSGEPSARPARGSRPRRLPACRPQSRAHRRLCPRPPAKPVTR